MGTEYWAATFEVKAVNLQERTIEGHAAVFDTIDRVDDSIDPGAFTKTLSEKKPADIGVFIGHDLTKLPVGIPLEIRPDGKGLFTKTLIKPTAEGDELLGTAKFMQEHGQPLGMSIGYHTRDASYIRREGKSVRRLLDIDLGEYSYAPRQAIAHQDALVTAVKTAMEKALSEGSDTGGGFLANGKGRKAELDAEARNNLDDSDFAWIDSEGGTHLPINDAEHVRAAMARFGQTNFDSESAKAKAWKKILAAAKKFDIDVEDESMPKGGIVPPEVKAGPEQMSALRKVVKAHKDAMGAHQDAMDAHKAAMDSLTAYHTSTKNGDFDDDGDNDSVPDEKTVLRWVSRLEAKAGATMSNSHKGMLHDAMDALQKLHKTQCKDPNCKYQAADGDESDDGDGPDAAKTMKAYQDKIDKFAALTATAKGG